MIPVNHKGEREELTRTVTKPSSPLGPSRTPVSLARTTIVALVAAIVGGTVVALVIDRTPPTSPVSARTQTDSSAVTGPLRLGTPVLAIGTPFGYAGSASAGIISGFNRQIESPNGYPLADAIQTDAAVNHGNSGGPLLDVNGEVVGVNAQLANSGVNGNVGVAFAIPVDAGARKVIEQLSTSGKALHAWLGIAGATLNAQLAAAIGLPRVRGVLVTGIAPASPAARAGLEAGSHVVRLGTRAYCAGGDVVTAIGGATVTTSSGLQNALERFQPGSTIVVGIVHGDGTRAQRSLKLVAQPAKRSPITQDC